LAFAHPYSINNIGILWIYINHDIHLKYIT